MANLKVGANYKTNKLQTTGAGNTLNNFTINYIINQLKKAPKQYITKTATGFEVCYESNITMVYATITLNAVKGQYQHFEIFNKCDWPLKINTYQKKVLLLLLTQIYVGMQ